MDEGDEFAGAQSERGGEGWIGDQAAGATAPTVLGGRRAETRRPTSRKSAFGQYEARSKAWARGKQHSRIAVRKSSLRPTSQPAVPAWTISPSAQEAWYCSHPE